MRCSSLTQTIVSQKTQLVAKAVGVAGSRCGLTRIPAAAGFIGRVVHVPALEEADIWPLVGFVSTLLNSNKLHLSIALHQGNITS